MSFFFLIALCFIITLISILLLIPISHKCGLVDIPGGRKRHFQNTPVIGGFAMAIGFFVTMLLSPIQWYHFQGIIFGTLVLVILGVIDDLFDLSARIRVIGQIIVASIAIYFHNEIWNLGTIFLGDPIHLGELWGYIVTVLAIVGYINAVNMVDGADGLAGTICFSQVAILLIFALHHNRTESDALTYLLVALFVFLIFNFPRRTGFWKYKIFMGDVGSTFLGFTIAWFCISLSQGPHAQAKPVTMLWITGLPICDLFSVMLRRIQKKKSPFQAGREHLHHIFISAKFNNIATTIIIGLISCAFGGIGLLLEYTKINSGYSFIIFIGVFVTYYLLMRKAWLVKKRLYCIRKYLLGSRN